MGIIHIVLIEFKEEVTNEQVKDVYNRFLALKDLCLLPNSKKPYITKPLGGKDNSVEGMTGGITHIFISEFTNEKDRKYYLEEDQAHLGFGKIVESLVKNAQVLDFVPGVV